MTVPARRTLSVLAWALYDFANTIYALNVLSFHFPLHLTSDLGVPEWIFAVSFALSSLLAAMALPVCGYLSDRFHTGRRLLVLSTLACVACTALLGVVDSAAAAVALFALSHVFYQAAMIFYNARIVEIGQRDEKSLGLVSGLGVAVGYVGTLTALFLTNPFFKSGGHQATMIPTAALFILFAIPCLLLRGAVRPTGTALSLIEHAAKYDPRRIVALLRATKPLEHFAMYSFWILNVSAVAALFMTVFAKQAAGLNDAEINRMLLATSLAGIAGALVAGWAYGRTKAENQLSCITAVWAAAFLLNAFYRQKWAFFGAAGLCGVAFGATWSMTRVYVLRLIPGNTVGEYYGIFGFLGRIAALTGLLFVGGAIKAADTLGLPKYDLLNGCLLGGIALAAIWLFRIRRDIDQPNRYNNFS